MVQAIPAAEVTLGELKKGFGLNQAEDADFFSEWTQAVSLVEDKDKSLLDRVKRNYLELMADPPLLENTVKMVVLAPLLDLSGFYHRPFRIETETGVSIQMRDEQTLIRGRIDVLVLNQRIWMLVIESKRSDFAVTRALPQALSYMLASPQSAQSVQSDRPTYGMITNGNEFLFLKVTRQPIVQYANSRLFSLLNPGNELQSVLSVLRHLGSKIEA